MLANTLDRIRWRQFVLARVENMHISLSHEVKQVRYTCNIRRFLSHQAKQARYTCNIRRSLSHEAKQARYICNSDLKQTDD